MLNVSVSLFWIEVSGADPERVTLGCCLHPVKTAPPVNYTDGSEYAGQQSAGRGCGILNLDIDNVMKIQ